MVRMLAELRSGLHYRRNYVVSGSEEGISKGSFAGPGLFIIFLASVLALTKILFTFSKLN